jgi:chromosome segregation ATPase
MSNLAHRESHLSGVNGHGHPLSDTADQRGSDSSFNFVVNDEMRRELEGALQAQGANAETTVNHPSAGLEPVSADDELTLLRKENAELRAKVEELEQHIQAALDLDATWSERQKEYEVLLEEKSEVIRGLHQKIQELQEGGAVATSSKEGGEQPASVSDAELLPLKEKLERERAQLREDEEALMEQMRGMELTMSRDRAELARQRTELQRLQQELNREIEMAARDGHLRDRLQSLQRRSQEVMTRKGGAAAPAAATAAGEKAGPPAGGKPSSSPDKKSSGIFRRLFGGD